MQSEFYSRPVFFVADVTGGIAYYCEKLGFERNWSFPEHDPIIAQVGRNGLDIILNSRSAVPVPAIPSVLSMTLHEPRALGRLYEELRSRGATVNEPFETPWEKGLYQLDARDPEGNVLVFWGEKPE